MKNTKTTALGVRISKEEKEALQKETDKRGLTLSDLVKEMIPKMITKKVDTSSPGKNSPGKPDPENKEEKEFDNLLEAVILYKAGELDI